MKNWMCIAVLFLGSAASAQNNPFRKLLDESSVEFTLGFKKFENLPNALTLYSPTAMVTNEYIPSNGGYFRSNASNLPVSLNGITVDSFNPNGAINAQTAIGMGLIRTLLKL